VLRIRGVQHVLVVLVPRGDFLRPLRRVLDVAAAAAVVVVVVVVTGGNF